MVYFFEYFRPFLTNIWQFEDRALNFTLSISKDVPSKVGVGPSSLKRAGKPE